MARFSIRFLGCEVSHADAQAIRERLIGDGLTETRGPADIAVVNARGITHEAARKSRRPHDARSASFPRCAARRADGPPTPCWSRSPVDRPGRGYGDDYTPWLVDAAVGDLVRVRAERVVEEGIVGVPS